MFDVNEYKGLSEFRQAFFNLIKMKIKTYTKELLADLYTPVGIYLNIRNHFSNAHLLESSDYAGSNNAQSIICCGLLKEISILDHKTTIKDTIQNTLSTSKTIDAVRSIQDFLDSISFEESDDQNGVFGYTSFDAIKYFDPTLYRSNAQKNIPDIIYGFYRYVLIIDHFKDSMKLIENCPIHEESKMDNFLSIIQYHSTSSFPFRVTQKPTQNISDQQFLEHVKTAKAHCQRGDVFQVVPSIRYDIGFIGDEFNVYRNLRSINPSPYLFYFDYTDFRIFGSSPEAQIKVNNHEAEIHPIAGTVKRTGDEEKDLAAANQLLNDPKENAEHVMLVDLARNDLSKNCKKVTVTKFKEVQYFSHVVHLTSVVTGRLNKDTSAYRILADTFPAGTLSGAPKHKAVSIIEKLEPNHRGLYGGAIGMLGFNQSLNHAIIIRSILSTNNTLSLQAGAGITIKSNPKNELEEVQNKLAALKKSIDVSSPSS